MCGVRCAVCEGSLIYAVCGSVRRCVRLSSSMCGSVRLSGSVAVCGIAVVGGSGRQCVIVCVAVCDSRQISSRVWQCERMRARQGVQ